MNATPVVAERRSIMCLSTPDLTPWEMRELDRYLNTIWNAEDGLRRSTAQAAEHAMVLGRTLQQLRGEPKLWKLKDEDEGVGWERFCTEALGYSPRAVLYKIGLAQVLENLQAAFGSALLISARAANVLVGEDAETQAAVVEMAGPDASEQRMQEMLDRHRAGKQAKASGRKHREHRSPMERVTAALQSLRTLLGRPRTLRQVPVETQVRLVSEQLLELLEALPPVIRERARMAPLTALPVVLEEAKGHG